MLKKLIMGFMLLMILGFIAIGVLIMMPGKEEIDSLTYFGEFTEGQQNMVYDDVRVEWDTPVIKEDMLYVESQWANEYINDRLYYDQKENVLTITNLQEVIRVYPDKNKVTVNNQNSDRKVPTLVQDGKLYIGESYLEENYAFDITMGKDERLVVASNLKQERRTGIVTKKTSTLRTHADKKKLIVDHVEKGEEVIIYDEVGKHLRVRNQNGMIGYIPAKDVAIKESTAVKEDKVFEAMPILHPLNDKVKMVWDQMTVRTSGDWSSNKYTKINGANVISPTWFEFADAEGNLVDRGSTQYVQEAHARGLQVWPLMSHNFSEPQYTREILTSTYKRQHVIDQLVTATKAYGVEGINIDIENIQADFGNEWVQFMRELYPQMQAIGVTVSVDIYMPSAWSGHYQRDKVAEVVDYFIVMAYDQHWSGGEQSGPTAGLAWVEEGIQANLEQVPADKLVLGIPFFTRIWEEEDNKLRSSAYGMKAAQNIVAKWGVSLQYDEEHKQNYAEYAEGNVTYKVWLEDSETIAKRIELINKYNLAGFSGWKLGLEGSEIWTEFNNIK